MISIFLRRPLANYEVVELLHSRSLLGLVKPSTRNASLPRVTDEALHTKFDVESKAISLPVSHSRRTEISLDVDDSCLKLRKAVGGFLMELICWAKSEIAVVSATTTIMYLATTILTTLLRTRCPSLLTANSFYHLALVPGVGFYATIV